MHPTTSRATPRRSRPPRTPRLGEVAPGSAAARSLVGRSVGRVVIGLVLLAWGGWGAPAAAQSAERADAPQVQDGAPAPFTQEIEGTLVSFDLAPVPGGTVDGETVAPFYMATTELTWDLYDVFLYKLDEGGANAAADAVSRPSKPYVLPGEHYGHQAHPALAMTFKAANAFAEWISAKTGRTYRLPTEAEWEHACRAGRTDGADPATYAWTWENAGDETHPVGSLAPNAFGLHDLEGHVAEWVVGRDGEPVVKGGSFQDDAADVGCAARAAYDPLWQMTDPQLPKSTWWFSDAPFLGLRLVHVPD